MGSEALTATDIDGVLFITHPPFQTEGDVFCTGEDATDLRDVMVEGTSRLICRCTGCGEEWMIPQVAVNTWMANTN